MKKMMMALAAVVLTSVASAVTYTWSGAKGSEAWDTSTATFKTSNGDAIKIVGDFTLTITIKMVEDWSTDWINPVFKLTATDDKGTLFVKSNNENTSGSEKHVAYANVSNKDFNLGGHFTQSRMEDVTFTFDFKDYNAETNTYATLICTAQGKEWSNTNNTNFSNVVIGADEITYTGLTIDSNVTDFSMTLSGDGVLPEPTVMALLALGVAGVALRRKLA